MITTENKNFLRIILLLYDAASFILRHIIARELEKHGDDLDNLLKKDEFNNKLKHQLHFGKSQIEKLFPCNGKTDIKTWDSQMLAVVGTLIFRSTLSKDEKFYINNIKHARNRIAHKALAFYSDDDFDDEKDAIVKGINFLASSFDATVQEKCEELISAYCLDPLEHVQLAIKHLEEDTTNRELLGQIRDAINEKHEIVRKDMQDHAEKIENTINLTEKKICESQETVLKSVNGLCLDIGNVDSKVTESKETSLQELKRVNATLTNHIVNEAGKVSQKVDLNNSLLREVQQNQNEHAAKLESKLEELKQLFEQISGTGGHYTKQIKFGTHTHLTVDGPTQEWINTVETVLKNVFDILLNNVQEPGQNPETERAVKEFLNYIKGFKGVELKSVERKCILLAFECLTYDSLRELIEFINSDGFLSYLESIARALEKDLKIPQNLVISSEILVSSLQLVFDDKSSSVKPESERGISLSFECTSIDGLDAFWRLFVKGEATPYIDNIAANVSSGLRLREKTSLSTAVNLQEFEDALTHLEATLTKDKETKLLKPCTRCKDLKFSGKENYQDVFRKLDSSLSVVPSVQDTKSEDIKNRSEISGQSYQRLAQSYQEPEHEIDSVGTRYSNEQHIGILTEQANVSSLHCVSLINLKEIHVRFGFMFYIKIYSCAILSRERLMIAHYTGLSVLNIHTGLVEQKKNLDTRYSDIAVLPNDQVAVTLPRDDEMVILNTNDMSLIRRVPTEFLPCGITYHQDELYLVCGWAMCVNILNLQGCLLRKIECNKSFNDPFSKIAVSLDAQSLYILNDKSLFRISAQGQEIAVCSFESKRPKSLTILNDSSLVVVSETIHGIHTIHHISADLQQGYELKIDKGYVHFLGVDPVNNQIYAIYNDTIKVYYMQKQPIQCQSEMKLTAETADEKVSSFEAGPRFSYLEADKELTSLKAGEKLPSFESYGQLLSLKNEMKLPSIETNEKLALFKAETSFYSHETDILLPQPRLKLSWRNRRALQFQESASFEAGTRLHSRETDEVLDLFKDETGLYSRDEETASFEAGTRLPSQKTDKESALFRFLRETRENMCQLM